MQIRFVAGFGPIVQDPEAARSFCADALGPDLAADGDDRHTGGRSGAKHFALWPLGQAAQSRVGTQVRPADVPVPRARLEFDVADVGAATREPVEECGHHLPVCALEEPWGQTVTRLLGPEGLRAGVTCTPLRR